MRIACIIAALSLSPAFAQDFDKKDPIDISMQECLKDKKNSVDIQGCVDDADEAWDKEMNRVYQLMLNTAEPKLRKALVAAQRAWLQWRKQEIELYILAVSGGEPGTMYLNMAASKAHEATRRRAIELRAYQKDVPR